MTQRRQHPIPVALPEMAGVAPAAAATITVELTTVVAGYRTSGHDPHVGTLSDPASPGDTDRATVDAEGRVTLAVVCVRCDSAEQLGFDATSGRLVDHAADGYLGGSEPCPR